VQVYYCSLQGVDFFSVDAESLRDFSTNSDLSVLNTRMALGKKESLSDGIGFDCLVGTRKLCKYTSEQAFIEFLNLYTVTVDRVICTTVGYRQRQCTNGTCSVLEITPKPQYNLVPSLQRTPTRWVSFNRPNFTHFLFQR
jgi:hypothetical protein